MYQKYLIFSLCTLLLSACAGKVNLKESDQKVIADKNYRFAKIEVVVADKAISKKTKPGYFKKDDFVKIFTKQFYKAGLIDSDSPYTLKIQITKLHIRSNLIAFLSIPESDKLFATVSVYDGSNQVVDRFEVKSTYSLGGTASGLSTIRTGFLYRNFGKMTQDLFKGVVEAEEEIQ